MYRFLNAVLSVACLCIAGCGADTEVEEEKGGRIEIKVPGVEIEVNEQEGVRVKAPETDVKVNKEGVEVTAPGTDVKLKPSGDAEGNTDTAN